MVVKGIWSGEFAQGDFLDNDCFTKSVQSFVGVKSFFTNSCTYRVFAKNLQEDRISDSIYLLMSKSDFYLDPQYPGYKADFKRITKRIERYNSHIHSGG